jgi:hypothetical protein
LIESDNMNFRGYCSEKLSNGLKNCFKDYELERIVCNPKSYNSLPMIYFRNNKKIDLIAPTFKQMKLTDCILTTPANTKRKIFLLVSGGKSASLCKAISNCCKATPHYATERALNRLRIASTAQQNGTVSCITLDIDSYLLILVDLTDRTNVGMTPGSMTFIKIPNAIYNNLSKYIEPQNLN